MSVMLGNLNLTGLIIGASAFLIIAFARYITIKVEYYFTKKFWVVFLIIGISAIAASLIEDSFIFSSILSILAFNFLWGIGEIIEQEKRVDKGWFPKNPRRK